MSTITKKDLALLVSQSLLAWGGLALIAASALDMFDGAVARATGRVSKFGGFLDSVADRISEAVVLAGMLAHFLSESDDTGALLALAAIGERCLTIEVVATQLRLFERRLQLGNEAPLQLFDIE